MGPLPPLPSLSLLLFPTSRQTREQTDLSSISLFANNHGGVELASGRQVVRQVVVRRGADLGHFARGLRVGEAEASFLHVPAAHRRSLQRQALSQGAMPDR